MLKDFSIKIKFIYIFDIRIIYFSQLVYEQSKMNSDYLSESINDANNKKTRFELLYQLLESLTKQELYEYWNNYSDHKHKVYESMGYY